MEGATLDLAPGVGLSTRFLPLRLGSVLLPGHGQEVLRQVEEAPQVVPGSDPSGAVVSLFQN